MVSVHRLVALHFLPINNLKTYVNHIDGNKLNNSVDNLEWITPSENNKHAFLNKLSTPNFSKVGRNGISLKVYNDKEEFMFNSIKECSLFFGKSYSTIKRILDGKQKDNYGYIWKEI